MSREEGHRLNGAYIEVISKRTTHPVKSYGLFVDAITGIPVPQVILDSHRLNGPFIEAISKRTNHPVRGTGLFVEVISKLAQPAQMIYSMYAEMIEGIAVPQKILDSHRLSGQNIEAISKRTNHPVRGTGLWIEVIAIPVLYAPDTRVEFLY